MVASAPGSVNRPREDDQVYEVSAHACVISQGEPYTDLDYVVDMTGKCRIGPSPPLQGRGERRGAVAAQGWGRCGRARPVVRYPWTIPRPPAIRGENLGLPRRPTPGPAAPSLAPPPKGRGKALTPYFAAAIFAVSSGTRVNRSPTRPMSATWKIGASSSLLIATMIFESFMPARCWIAPLMPTAM